MVRARNKDLIVRARSGYIAGQSRPTSHYKEDQSCSEILRVQFPIVADCDRRIDSAARPRSSCARASAKSNEKVDSHGPLASRRRRSARARTRGASSKSITKAAAAQQSATRRNDAAAAAHTAANDAGNKATEAGNKYRHDGQGQQAPRLRSGPERRPGQLQVRQDRCCRMTAKTAARRDGRAAEAGSEGHLSRDRGPHGQRRRQGRSTRRSASSAPKR